MKCRLKARSQPSTRPPRLPGTDVTPDQENIEDEKNPKTETEVKAENLNTPKVKVDQNSRANDPPRLFPPTRHSEDISDDKKAEPKKRLRSQQLPQGQSKPNTPENNGPAPWWWRFTAGGSGTLTTVFPPWTDKKPAENGGPGASVQRPGSPQNAVAGSSPPLHGSAPSSGSAAPASRHTPQPHDSQQPGKSTFNHPATPSLAKAHVQLTKNGNREHMHLGIHYYTQYPFRTYTSMENLQTDAPLQKNKEQSVYPSTAPILTLHETHHFDKDKYKKSKLILTKFSPQKQEIKSKSSRQSKPSGNKNIKSGPIAVDDLERQSKWKHSNLDDYAFTLKPLALQGHGATPHENKDRSWQGRSYKAAATTGLSPAWRRKWNYPKSVHYYYNNFGGIDGPRDDYSVSSPPRLETSKSKNNKPESTVKYSVPQNEKNIKSLDVKHNVPNSRKYSDPQNSRSAYKHPASQKVKNKSPSVKHSLHQGRNNHQHQRGVRVNNVFQKHKNINPQKMDNAEPQNRWNPESVHKLDSLRLGAATPQREIKPQQWPRTGNKKGISPENNKNIAENGWRRNQQKYRQNVLRSFKPANNVTPKKHESMHSRESKITKVRQGRHGDPPNIVVDIHSHNEKSQSHKRLGQRLNDKTYGYSISKGTIPHTFNRGDTPRAEGEIPHAFSKGDNSRKQYSGKQRSPRLVWRGHKLVTISPSASHRSTNLGGDVDPARNLSVDTKPAPSQPSDPAVTIVPYSGRVHPGIRAVERALAKQRAKLREQASGNDSPDSTQNSLNNTQAHNLTVTVNGSEGKNEGIIGLYWYEDMVA